MNESSQPATPDDLRQNGSRLTEHESSSIDPDGMTGAGGGAPLNWGPPWIGPILHRTQIDGLWLLATMVLLMAGLVFFGWRGLLVVCTTGLSTLVTHGLIAWIFKRLWPTPSVDSSLHVLILGLLLGLALPVVCNSSIPVIAGIVMAAVCFGVGRSHTIRIHPVAATMVILWLPGIMGPSPRLDRGMATITSPHAVLRPHCMVFGDACDIAITKDYRPWLAERDTEAQDAIGRVEPGSFLQKYRQDLLDRNSALPRILVSGQLMPMTDILLGAVPGPIGGSSRALLIAIGLYLMYRRLAWWPMAVTALGAGLLTLLILPLMHNGQTTIVALRLSDMSWTVAMTYIAYMILASQMAMTILIFAPQTAPTCTKGKLVYGFVIGSMVMAVGWFTTPLMAGHISLVLGGLLSRPLDALHKSSFST